MEKLKGRFGKETTDLVAMALNYVLAMPNVCCVIPGFRNDRQASANASAAGRYLSAEDVKFVQDTLRG